MEIYYNKWAPCFHRWDVYTVILMHELYIWYKDKRQSVFFPSKDWEDVWYTSCDYLFTFETKKCLRNECFVGFTLYAYKIHNNPFSIFIYVAVS